MRLDFNNRTEEYLSFEFNKGVQKEQLLDLLKLRPAVTSSELNKNTHEITRFIIEKLGEMPATSIFTIDNLVSVNFNNEARFNLKPIIDDFLMKSKFKKHKGLLPWIPLLQDHFWLNEEPKPKKEWLEKKIKSGKAKSGESFSEYLQSQRRTLKGTLLDGIAVKKSTPAKVSFWAQAPTASDKGSSWYSGVVNTVFGTQASEGSTTPVPTETPDALAKAVSEVPKEGFEDWMSEKYRVQSSAPMNDIPPGFFRVFHRIRRTPAEFSKTGQLMGGGDYLKFRNKLQDVFYSQGKNYPKY